MALKFKDPNESDLKKVMIYGKDGTGKSTFAADYCSENNLSPVVIDVDDTNRTRLFSEGRVLQLDFKSDVKTFNEIKNAVTEISKMDEFDTIILDGVTSLLEMLVSDARGLAKYSDRATRFQKLIQALLSSGKNLIFIGQADMEVIYTEEVQSSKMVIKVNSIVNEKYLCEIDSKGDFIHKVVKFRTVDGVPGSIVDGEIPSETDDDPLKEICQRIKKDLVLEGKLVTKSTMKSQVVKLVKAGEIEKSMRPPLIKYIQDKCPEELN